MRDTARGRRHRPAPTSRFVAAFALGERFSQVVDEGAEALGRRQERAVCDAVLMFKTLVPQVRNRSSDEQAELQIMNLRTFSQFPAPGWQRQG